LDDADFRGMKGRLVSEVKMFIVDVGDMKIDADTADFVIDGAHGLVARIEDAVSDRDLTRIESELGRLQVVVHHALKRSANPAVRARVEHTSSKERNYSG
jgi:hypothetical protein